MAKKRTSVHKASKKEEVNEHKKKNKSFSEQLIPKNQDAWITTGIFVLIGLIVGGLIVYGAGLMSAQATEEVCEVPETINVDVMELESKVADYLNDNLMNPELKSQGAEFVVKDSNKFIEGIYAMPVYLSQDGQEQLIAITYATEDKLILAQGEAIDLNKPIEQVQTGQETVETQEPVQTQEYSEEDKNKIIEFSECLAEKGVKIYGANWCGPTNAFVENIGGFDLISSIYVECTENEEICESEAIQGYPTVKLNGEKIQPERSFAGLSAASGCEVPNLEMEQQATSAGQC
jgi:hypothetical protein